MGYKSPRCTDTRAILGAPGRKSGITLTFLCRGRHQNWRKGSRKTTAFASEVYSDCGSRAFSVIQLCVGSPLQYRAAPQWPCHRIQGPPSGCAWCAAQAGVAAWPLTSGTYCISQLGLSKREESRKPVND